MAMLTRIRCRTSSGSGTAIGVAMVFPMLMAVIVLLLIMSNSSRTEQALQSAANRAAQVASVCCPETPEAAAAAAASLEAATVHAGFNNVSCVNDLATTSVVAFTDVAGNDIPAEEGVPVPPGGVVTVRLLCLIPPESLGGVGMPGLEIRRGATGVAVIDPYRFRAGT